MSQDVVGVLWAGFLGAASVFITVQVDYLPVFKPNDYFWEHHWQKDKEEQWEAYARVVRQIICDHGGFEMSDLEFKDKKEYQQKLKELYKGGKTGDVKKA